MSDKIYPIGIQNFEKLRKEGYFYIDKTALIYKMVKTGSYYFLSRPRRFGKSLLVSTLEAYFQGKRELFEGLAIAGLEKDWTVRPVLHIDLNISKYETAEDLSDMLNDFLTNWEAVYGSAPSETSLALRSALNVDLWERLLPLIAAHDVRYHWVKGHAENEYNNRCDELAVAESRKYK